MLSDANCSLPVTGPDLDKPTLEAMSLPELRDLGRELRVNSHLDGVAEFATYLDETMTREYWLDAVRRPPRTTTHVNLCIVKPTTKPLGGSYATTVLANQPEMAGRPTDFVSHAWRYDFAAFVSAVEAEAAERDRVRADAGQPPDTTTRYYWNDIFVEDQNSTESKPEGYFFTAFRQAVATIGRTLLVLEPLAAAIPFTRAWCVWEIFCSVDSKSELNVCMSPKERAEFRRLLMSEFTSLVKILSVVDSTQGQAFVVRGLGSEPTPSALPAWSRCCMHELHEPGPPA